jgi:hypothetical protein
MEVLEGMEVSGKLESVWLLVCCSFGAFFSLRQRSRGVFSGPVFAARLWFLPLGLRSEMVAPMYIAKFALSVLFVAEDTVAEDMENGYLADEIPRRGVMSRVRPDMLRKDQTEGRVRIGEPGSPAYYPLMRR